MAARLVINEDPELLMKDVVEGWMKGNHTLMEMLDLLEVVGKEIKLHVKQ